LSEKEALIEIIEGDKYIVGLRNDDIVHVLYKANTLVDKNLQIELIQVFNDICDWEKKCFIFETEKNCNMTSEARKYALKIENELPFKASVIIAQNAVVRIIAEFYYKIHKPKTPYNFYSKFEDGIKWLKQF
jgi:hypothetical protein